jgi:Tol biopolymer transport system component
MNKKVLIGILVVVAIGIIVSVIGLFHFLSKRSQSKEYLLAVSKGTFYRISSDGREIKELGESVDGEVRVYSFSPDGKKILFGIHPFGNPQPTSLWIMDSDGSNREKIIDVAEERFEDALFSPNGKEILFRTSIEKPVDHSESSLTIYSLWKINLDGSNKKRLVDGTKGSVGGVSFSPDGGKILLLINETAPTKTLQQIESLDYYSLWIIDAEGNNKKSLGVRVKGWLEPGSSFSPDGEKILFIALTSEGRSLWIMDSDGNGKIKVALDTNTEVYEAQFSRDGSRIYFVTEGTKPTFESSSWYLWIVDTDGTNKRNITGDMNADVLDFSLSPDGSKIAFVVAPSPYKHFLCLWVMNADGTDRKKLTEETREIGLPDSPFSPTGNKILLRDSSVWIVNLDGSEKVDLDKATGMNLYESGIGWFPAISTKLYSALQNADYYKNIIKQNPYYESLSVEQKQRIIALSPEQVIEMYENADDYKVALALLSLDFLRELDDHGLLTEDIIKSREHREIASCKDVTKERNQMSIPPLPPDILQFVVSFKDKEWPHLLFFNLDKSHYDGHWQILGWGTSP